LELNLYRIWNFSFGAGTRWSRILGLRFCNVR
jgi:hypothetical protein